MQAFLIELRERVLKAVEQRSGTIEAIAKLFSVSQGFIFKLLRQWRETGSVALKPHGGRPAPILGAPQLAHLRKAKARTLDLLDKGLAEGLRLVTPRDIHGWFAHYGYNFTSG